MALQSARAPRPRGAADDGIAVRGTLGSVERLAGLRRVKVPLMRDIRVLASAASCAGAEPVAGQRLYRDTGLRDLSRG